MSNETFHLRELTLLDLIIVRRNLPDEELDQMLAFSGRAELPEDYAARMWRSEGPKWAIADADERAVACGGITPVRPGVGESWFIATQQAWIPHTNLTDIVRKVKNDALVHWGWHRLETYCLATREKAESWYTFCLGMRREATLERFCSDGRNAKLFSATVCPSIHAGKK